MDIRNYFSLTATQKKGNNAFTTITKKDAFKGKGESKVTTKKRRLVIESDSDEDPLPTKKQNKASPVQSKAKLNLAALQKRKTDPKPLKPVSPKDFFNISSSKLCNGHVNEVDIVDDFDKTLKQLDQNASSNSSAKVKDTEPNREPARKESLTDKKSPNKIGKLPIDVGINRKETKPKLPTPKTLTKSNNNVAKQKHKVENISKVDIKQEILDCEIESISKVDIKQEIVDCEMSVKESKSSQASQAPKQESKQIKTSPSENKQEKNVPKIETETQEDKSRRNSQNYRNYLHREGPQALGTKELPKGEENCLQGLTFILTGVLESFERDEMKDLIITYGGKVMNTITKNTKYMVVGRDAGPAKLDKAEKFGTTCLNEDELLELIRTRPGKSSTKTTSKTVPKKETASKEILGKYKSESVSKEIHEIKSENVSDAASETVASKSTTEVMWVDRYKPTCLKQVIGQQGDRSGANKLLGWLRKWQNNRASGKKAASGKWNAKDDGSIFKAALLSGPPGVGKTTTAQLACKEVGYDFIELNASDTRSKKCLQSEIAELLQNETISGLFQKKQDVRKHAIIFDEVDGMSGNEDRGGTQELIALIKQTKIPVICICNDRAHPKIRSLSNHCFDLRFPKPRVEQIKAGMMSLLYKEKLKVAPEMLHEIITASNQDLRQVLNHLSYLSSKGISDAKNMKTATKDVKLSPFEVLKKVFATEESHASLNDKASLFFHDYSLAPLFVHENYPAVKPVSVKGDIHKHLKLLGETADSVSYGDIIDRTIRSTNNWSLLPTQAIFASVVPGANMRGYLSQMINFPSWLGKNSSRNHMDRILQQVHMHTRLGVSANKTELGLDYLQQLKMKFMKPLEYGSDYVPDVLNVMENYSLLREDLDSIVELSLWPGQKDPMAAVEPKVKAALTRTYNKESFKTPYAVVNVKKGKKRSLDESIGEDEIEDPENENDDDDDDVAVDAMVKQKKRNKDAKEVPKTTGKGKGQGKSSTRGRGRGKK